MDDKTKNEWWNHWLKHFLENRKHNKPVALSDTECQSLFMLLPELDFVMDDAIEILCKGLMPSTLNHLLWLKLSEKKLVSAHTNSFFKLLIKLLSTDIHLENSKHYISSIVQEMSELKSNEKKQLQEVLLKHNINLNLTKILNFKKK